MAHTTQSQSQSQSLFRHRKHKRNWMPSKSEDFVERTKFDNMSLACTHKHKRNIFTSICAVCALAGIRLSIEWWNVELQHYWTNFVLNMLQFGVFFFLSLFLMLYYYFLWIVIQRYWKLSSAHSNKHSIKAIVCS